MTYLLIDNYDSFTWNLVHRFGDIGAECHVIRNDTISVHDILKKNWQGIIISPGPCDPNKAGICLDLVKAIDSLSTPIPLLGVCLGHQIIGQYFGGHITRCTPVHGKTDTITIHDNTDIFKNCDQQIIATRYHSLHIADNTLNNAPIKITAYSSDCLNMAIAHHDKPFYGVQFHPESIKTEIGFTILQNFITISEERHYKKTLS